MKHKFWVENLAWESTDRLFFAINIIIQGGGQIWWDLGTLPPLTNLLQECKHYLFIKFSFKALIFNKGFFYSKQSLSEYLFLRLLKAMDWKENWVHNWMEFFFLKKPIFHSRQPGWLPPGLGCNLDFVSRSLQPICDKVRLAVCRTLPDYVVSPLLVK